MIELVNAASGPFKSDAARLRLKRIKDRKSECLLIKITRDYNNKIYLYFLFEYYYYYILLFIKIDFLCQIIRLF